MFQLANTLSFILFYTTRDPHVQIQIRDEIDSCGNDFTRAHFTKACIQEVFRLTPTAFCLARLLEEDTNLSGFDLKAGVRYLNANANITFITLLFFSQ